MKKILAMILATLMLLGTAAIAEGTSFDAVMEKGTFVLGLDDSFPPMGYRDEQDNIVGYDIDLAQEVCDRLGVELKLQPIAWSAKEMELDSGNIDCIWNGLSITPARQEAMSMTFAYLHNGMVLIALKDKGYTSWQDMAGCTIGVQTGSYAQELLESEQFADFYASVEELGYDEYQTALNDLLIGGVDGIIIDKVVYEYRTAQMGTDEIALVEVLEDDIFGIGFRKQDVALCHAVEAILAEMYEDGAMAEISTKWFGEDISIIE